MKSKCKAESGGNCEHCKTILFVTTLQGNFLKIMVLIAGTYFCNQTLSILCVYYRHIQMTMTGSQREIFITTRPSQTLQKFLTREYKIVLIRVLKIRHTVVMFML